MLTFGAEHPFHARVDLPDDVAAMPELAAMLCDPAAHHRVDRVVLLLYADDEALAEAAWHALRAAFDAHRIAVVEALRVGRTGGSRCSGATRARGRSGWASTRSRSRHTRS